jgi:hypothetical protein
MALHMAATPNRANAGRRPDQDGESAGRLERVGPTGSFAGLILLMAFVLTYSTSGLLPAVLILR